MKRLLVVDDHENALYFLRVLLEGHGYSVELARNGAEALDKARESPPDAIISDILMPVMDGFALCRAWRADERLAGIPFIFYTATYTDPKDEKLGLGLGADAFITKPAEPENFMAALRRVLSKHETEDLVVAPSEHEREDEGVLKQYNDALVRKLEDKMLQLEQANQALEQEISAHRQTEAMLRRQKAGDELVEELLSRIAGASASEIDGHIAEILQMIAEFMGVDSAMVVQASEDLSNWGVASGWVTGGLERVSVTLGTIRMGTLPRIETELLAGRTVILRSADDLPAEVDELRRLWESHEITSILLVPLRGRGALARGCLLLFSSFEGPVWEHQEVRQAEQIGKAIANVLERKRVEDSLRANEEQLQQSQRMEIVGQMAGGIAHDFNNLLTAIIGYSDLALGSERSGASAGSTDIAGLMDDVREIRAAADRARELTRQMLAFSRRQTLRPEVIVLNDVVAETRPSLERTLGEDVELVLRLDAELGQCEVDRSQLVSTLMNLAVNALDAMPHGGKLTLESANAFLDESYCEHHSGFKPGSCVTLRVSDTGLGMIPEVESHIFEPFFTTKSLGKGAGLGLPMIYGFVKQSGGNIAVESELGKGTTFTIYLPRVNKPMEADRSAQPVGYVEVGGETILVVEDEEMVRTLVRRVLELHGYEVIAVGDGSAAWALLVEGARSVDLLLTDVVLPGELQGNDLADKVMRLRPGLPILYMSGYTQNAAVRGERLSAKPNFLEKPFTAEVLTGKVREALNSGAVVR